MGFKQLLLMEQGVSGSIPGLCKILVGILTFQSHLCELDWQHLQIKCTQVLGKSKVKPLVLCTEVLYSTFKIKSIVEKENPGCHNFVLIRSGLSLNWNIIFYIPP